MGSHLRLLRRLITALLLLLLLLTAVAYRQWQPLWQELGVKDLRFRFAKISWRQLDLDAVNFRYNIAQTEYALALERLSLTWHWPGLMPQLDLVKIQRLQLATAPGSSTAAPTTPPTIPPRTPISLPAQWQLPDWLPREFAVAQLEAALPCATGSCPIGGSLNLLRQQSQDWRLILSLSPSLPADPHRQLRLEADYRLRGGLPQLTYALAVPAFLSLQGETGLTAQKIHNWQGALALELSPPPGWVATALAAWGIIYATQNLPAFTQAATAKANWEMTLLEGSTYSVQGLSSADAKLDILLNLPGSLSLPQLGLISGLAQITLETARGEVNDYSASADISIQKPKIPAALSALGIAATSAQIKLASGADGGLDLAALPLQLSLQTSGATPLQLQTDLLLNAEQILVSGRAGNWRQLSIKGDLRLAADKLKIGHLLTQNWQWQATLAGEPTELRLDALLTNSAGVKLKHQINYRPNLLNLNWQLEDIFLLAGNPIRQTASKWPELLDINRGRIAAKGKLSYDLQQGALITHSQVEFKDINAIYDRSLLQGLSAQIKVHTFASQLQADAQLQIDQFNQGIVVGPLISQARYQAAFDDPLHGKLDLKQLKVSLMGGEVSLSPQSLDLSQTEQVLPFIVTDLELAQLLAQHPASELSGNGRLSGKIPVRISPNGVSVEAGAVAAIAPGGLLQYRPGNAAGLAASNQAMELVVEALKDFHYSELTGDVSYDNQGRLTLGLKLAGNNPTFEGGRAINLNINLEEDIPALLTSLQLSSKISDKITQRVQQYFLKQQGKAAPTGATHERP